MVPAVLRELVTDLSPDIQSFKRSLPSGHLQGALMILTQWNRAFNVKFTYVYLALKIF